MRHSGITITSLVGFYALIFVENSKTRSSMPGKPFLRVERLSCTKSTSHLRGMVVSSISGPPTLSHLQANLY